jgi:hypothetical protein
VIRGEGQRKKASLVVGEAEAMPKVKCSENKKRLEVK